MAKTPPRPSLLGSLGEAVAPAGEPAAGNVVSISQPTPVVSPRPDVVKSTVYLHPQVHRKLKEIAFAKDCKIHDLLMEGVSRILVEHGHPTVDELKIKS